MKKLLRSVLISILILSACSRGYGTAYNQKNLTIYYTKEEELVLVQKLADYWFLNELISQKPQSIRLFQSETAYQLQLIKTKTFDAKLLNFDAIKNLQALEDDLNRSVFLKRKVDIVICDSQYKVLHSLNY